ncbi:MAG: hypothetical protein RL562_1892 [Planctomycetota bacterium]
MRAAVVYEHGDFDRIVFELRPVPEPGPGEVRVRIKAAGLNHLDTWVRRGVPGHRFPLPLVLGSDGAGVVDALGAGVEGFEIGEPCVLLPGTSCGVCPSCLAGEDQLCRAYGILGESRDGTCAEYVCVPAANAQPKPENLGFAEAAAVPLVFQTAWSMLVRKAGLRAGETVLIHAGGSGVGSAGVQIARMMGATVLATAGGSQKCRHAEDLGAHIAIDYTAVDWVEEVKAATGGHGCDVVFEHVGAATFTGSIRSLTRGGRLVTCGATTGGQVELSLHQVFFKNLSILGNTMGSKGDLCRVLDLFRAGRLRPVVDTVMPLDQLADAHRRLEARDVFGKLVVEP